MFQFPAQIILFTPLFVNVESLLKYGGLLLIFLLIYGSTGLFFCFFLPSGAVLFAAGILAATGALPYSIFFIGGLLFLASVSGSLTGYGIGWKAGNLLYRRKDSRFFHKQHLVTADNFYKKYGVHTLTIGYFLPIIRTFSSMVAGMIRLPFDRFLLLSTIGSAIWVLCFVSAGYLAGSRPELKPYTSYLVIGFILVVTLPLLFKVIRELGRMRDEKNR